jgi:hypothetical protein
MNPPPDIKQPRGKHRAGHAGLGQESSRNPHRICTLREWSKRPCGASASVFLPPCRASQSTANPRIDEVRVPVEPMVLPG